MIAPEGNCNHNESLSKDLTTNIQKDNECCVNQNAQLIKQSILKDELDIQQPEHLMVEQVQSQITKEQRKVNEQGVQTMQILQAWDNYNDVKYETQKQCFEGEKQDSRVSDLKIGFLDLGQINQDPSHSIADYTQNKHNVIIIRDRENAVFEQNELDVEQISEEWERTIQKLNDKLRGLRRQYHLLMGLQIQQQEQIINKHSPQPISSPIPHPNLTINKVYDYQIQNTENQHMKGTQHQQIVNSEQQRSQQITEHNINNCGTCNHQHINGNDNSLQQRLDCQEQTHSQQHQNLYQHQLSNTHSLSTIPNKQTEMQSYSLGILSISLSNLATLKQSIDTLSYERINQLMSLEWLTSKISFKQKHYPSLSSTPQQLRLYAKRLLKLLINTNNQNNTTPFNNYIGNQDGLFHQLYDEGDIEYDQTEQFVSFFSQRIKNLIIICYYNKTIYIGPFITQNSFNEPIRQGHAIQIRENKYVYQGQFHANKKHGYGYIHFLNKNPKIYCGYWIDGFIDGSGKQIYHTGETYEGDFKLGLRDGVGQIYYQDDKMHGYQGQFYDGYKHGNGFQKFINGDTYTGSYFKDKFHGQGQYTWKNGTTFQGTFHQGLKHGQGLLIFTNGKQFQKYYDHNIQINIQNQDDKKTLRSSAISNITQSKFQEKHPLIQDKPKSSRNYKSQQSSKSILSAKSLSKDKSAKNIKSKKTIVELMKQKQLQQDLQNLNNILKPSGSQSSRKILSINKLSRTQSIMGKMYNISDRPIMRIGENVGIDMLRLGRGGNQGKSLISFNQSQRLQQGRESTHRYNNTNFQQF